MHANPIAGSSVRPVWQREGAFRTGTIPWTTAPTERLSWCVPPQVVWPSYDQAPCCTDKGMSDGWALTGEGRIGRWYEVCVYVAVCLWVCMECPCISICIYSKYVWVCACVRVRVCIFHTCVCCVHVRMRVCAHACMDVCVYGCVRVYVVVGMYGCVMCSCL